MIKVNLSNESENVQLDERITEALRKLSPAWASSNPETLPSCNQNEFFDTPFDFYEFNTALGSKNDKSAPGMDGIDYGLIKNLPIKHYLLLLDIFNEMHATSQYPEDWKK